MRVLYEEEAENFLEKEGLPVPRRGTARTLREARTLCTKIGFPLAMKVRGILHKSDVGGVKLDIRSVDEATAAYHHLMQIRGSTGVVVQEYMEGLQLLVGIKDDPTFGKVLAFGSGGIFTEVLVDVAFRVCPIDRTEALAMISETRVSTILFGARRQHFDVEKLVDFMVRISHLAVKHERLLELDVNPVIIDRHRVRAVDCRAVFTS